MVGENAHGTKRGSAASSESAPNLTTKSAAAAKSPGVSAKPGTSGIDFPEETEKTTEKTYQSDGPKATFARRSIANMRKYMSWSLSSYFNFNPGYFLQFRGIMNVIHTVLSMVVLILLSTACQLLNESKRTSDGFYCKAPETFLFLTACSAFLTSLLYLFCCLLSERTEALLFNTSFEVGYYIMYSTLGIVAGFCVLVSGFRSDMDPKKTTYDHRVTYSAAVIGLINGILFGASAIVFFITHQFEASSKGSVVDLETNSP